MCEKCQDRGFIEENHGLIVILCDCEKGKEYRAQQAAILGIPEVVDDSGIGQEGGIVNDPELGIVSRVEPNNLLARGDNPSEPKQPIKPKKKKKARKRAK